MRKFLSYILILFLLVLIGASSYFVYQQTLNPCEKTIEYRIGRFDTQFGISQTEFKTYVTEAAAVWEKALTDPPSLKLRRAKKVFVYNSTADFKINLIYDERQLATTQKQKTEFGLSAVEESFKNLDTNFNLFKSQYDQKVLAYEASLSSYNERKSTYDAKVSYWNNKGGAPKNEFQSLEAERRYLNAEVGELNNEASSINIMTKQLNILLEERNAKATEYNKIAEEYNKKYNGGLEFNQAEYISGATRPLSLRSGTGGQINVYQFGNKKDLILALTHELGHALGMDHVENPKSIMYFLTGINAETSPTLSSEDLAELKKVCKIN